MELSGIFVYHVSELTDIVYIFDSVYGDLLTYICLFDFIYWIE